MEGYVVYSPGNGTLSEGYFWVPGDEIEAGFIHPYSIIDWLENHVDRDDFEPVYAYPVRRTSDDQTIIVGKPVVWQ